MPARKLEQFALLVINIAMRSVFTSHANVLSEAESAQPVTFARVVSAQCWGVSGVSGGAAEGGSSAAHLV